MEKVERKRVLTLDELELADALVALDRALNRVMQFKHTVDIPASRRVPWSLLHNCIFDTCNHLDSYFNDPAAHEFMEQRRKMRETQAR